MMNKHVISKSDLEKLVQLFEGITVQDILDMLD